MLRSLAGGALFGEAWGEAPAQVIALHGWMRSHSDFAAALGPPSLGGALPVLAVDLPGFGATPPPPEVWGSEQYAAAMAALLDEAGDTVAAAGRPVVVVGHSFGGRVAVRLAASRPDLVRGLVLSGVPLVPRAGRGRGHVAFAYRAVRTLRRAGLVGEDRLEAARLRYGSEDYKRAEGVMRGVLVRSVNERYDDDLAALRGPVELVWGENDTETPLEVARAVVDRVPGARLTICAGAGHLTPLVAPGELRTAVQRALAS